jgi:hypothetical protein
MGFIAAEICYRSLSLPHSPLDIYLQRSHGLPLPYLASPALSFLTYLSPLAYLSILRTSSSPSSPLPSGSQLPKIDVPLMHLRERLSAHPRLKGTTVATLTLAQCQPPRRDLPPLIKVDDDATARPTLPLAQPMISHTFPQLPVRPQDAAFSSEYFTWILDFTSAGQYPGVVMSQSRMREIECVLDPSSADGMGDVGMMGFGGGQGLRSWVDLLVRINTSRGFVTILMRWTFQLNPAKHASHSTPSSERYTALYVSAFLTSRRLSCSTSNLHIEHSTLRHLPIPLFNYG